MNVISQLPDLAEAWSSEFWLRHCESYRVDTPDGPFGFVEEVLLSPEDEPEALAVRVGRFQTHLVFVPIGDVREIRPKWEVLALDSVPRL